VAWLVGGGLLVVLVVEGITLAAAVQAIRLHITVGLLHEIASIVSFVTVALAAWLVGLLRADYSDPSRRKTIGAVWDVATFWPRAVHPFAPPCYGERAIPEVVDRVLLLLGPNAPGQALPGQRQLADQYELTVPCGPVLLTGYSQGSIIAPAVAAQLPPDVLSRPDFALLTLACPARRLYGRAFPAYFGRQHLEELRDALTTTAVNAGATRYAAPTTSDRGYSPRPHRCGPRSTWRSARSTWRSTSISCAGIPWSSHQTPSPRRRQPTGTPDGGLTRAPVKSPPIS
jgi:hypothetical protein